MLALAFIGVIVAACVLFALIPNIAEMNRKRDFDRRMRRR